MDPRVYTNRTAKKLQDELNGVNLSLFLFLPSVFACFHSFWCADACFFILAWRLSRLAVTKAQFCFYHAKRQPTERFARGSDFCIPVCESSSSPFLSVSTLTALAWLSLLLTVSVFL
ncbi:hypothetical protein C8R42DRAFT_125753 [Lentinula raphanica]|nr:hypothetical protein C8R42DRAFT_125753 [Lentinula raphanica]